MNPGTSARKQERMLNGCTSNESCALSAEIDEQTPPLPSAIGDDPDHCLSASRA